MPDPNNKDKLLVIGAGPGGYTAAFMAAESGMDVTMMNDDAHPGGVCLRRGCIPSKTLLHIAKLIREAEDASSWGVTFPAPAIDLHQLRSWKDQVIEKLSTGVMDLCKRRNVSYIAARASFLDSSTVKLTHPTHQAAGLPGTISFAHAIVATGSAPAIPSPFRLDDPRIMDSTAALALDHIPPSLLVIGGGYIGLELGTVYAALGSRVTVVELTDGLLPGVDRDLVRPLERRLRKQFQEILLNTRLEALLPQAENIKATLATTGGAVEKTFDRVLIAVGRKPSHEGLALENTRVVVTERGFIQVDKQQQTDDPRVYAIGDVAGGPMLAHKASREAKVAVEAIKGAHAAFDSRAIPAVIFTDPEIAWCGLTETQSKLQNRHVRVARFPWAASGRAQTLGRTEGFTKIIMDKDNERVLGAGIVGPGAGELIAECVLAIEMGAVARDLAESIHPHPTLSETLAETAEACYGLATHIYRPRR